MNTLIPDLAQFRLEELGQTPSVEHPNAEISFKVDIEPSRIIRRVMVGILDESGKRGISIAIYPATGEVCDMTHRGGVIGYLSRVPLNPGVPVPCDLTLHRCGKNFVCSVRVHGELFLYPAFSMEGNPRLTAFVGQESMKGERGSIGWSRPCLDVLEPSVAA